MAARKSKADVSVLESLPSKIVRRLRWLVRDMRPNRWVEREVAGVRMAMPWSHRLPDYASADPAYGENLLQLAEMLAGPDPLKVLDVGANIGDSTLLILQRVDARVLAVEPDEVFLPFLRRNVEGNDRVVVEESLLLAEPTFVGRRAVRVGGTARFVPDDAPSRIVPSITVDDLRRKHHEFSDVRLVKSDTDGYDTILGPAIARVWADSRPVLFLEYDERLTRAADLQPRRLWSDLQLLGYSDVAVWDNGGHPLFRTRIEEMGDLLAREYPTHPRAFWDVAAVHSDDQVGRAALRALIPG